MNHARSAVRLAVATASLALAVSSLGWVPSATANAAVTSPQIGAIGALPTVKKVKTKITTQPKSATIGRYGTRTSATFTLKAKGTKLRYTWQYQRPGSTTWKSIAKATKKSYQAKASAWPAGAKFRVVVKGKKGSATSKAATLTVLYPTTTPAADAMGQFGLTGITQGVDLSAWQYGISMPAVTSWVGADGFVMLRNASGSRPANTAYTDLCSGASVKSGAVPVTKDCAYAGLADAAAGRRLGHYWFNGWISAMDTTSTQAFARGYTPEASATQFVAWLLADGNYTTASTDPLVLDIEGGSAWTKTINGKKKTLTLRAWKPSEALAFLRTVRQLLTSQGYHANLYVYMGANNAASTNKGAFVWSDVAAITRLWVASWGTDNGRIPTTAPRTGPWPEWSIWQYTANARVAGSGMGALDADIARANAWAPKS
jgi:GH25 family lysozyme M1 (1,4-beta-N-acetylmuramidase)